MRPYYLRRSAVLVSGMLFWLVFVGWPLVAAQTRQAPVLLGLWLLGVLGLLLVLGLGYAVGGKVSRARPANFRQPARRPQRQPEVFGGDRLLGAGVPVGTRRGEYIARPAQAAKNPAPSRYGVELLAW